MSFTFDCAQSWTSEHEEECSHGQVRADAGMAQPRPLVPIRVCIEYMRWVPQNQQAGMAQGLEAAAGWPRARGGASVHGAVWCMCQWVSQDRSLEQALTPMQEESELEVLPPPQRRYGGARCSHPRSLCRRWSRCHERARPTIPSGRGWHTSPTVVCSNFTISQRRFTIARPPVPRCKRHSNESERYSNHQQPAAPHSQLQRHGSCLKMLSRKRPCSFLTCLCMWCQKSIVIGLKINDLTWHRLVQ